MKRIKFDIIQRNKFLFVLMIVSIICFIVGIFLQPFQDSEINRYFLKFGFILQSIYFGRFFWYKNYVQYDKYTVIMKINAFIGKSIIYENVEKVNLSENVVEIVMKNDKIFHFNVENIFREDVLKLFDIFNKNCNLNNSI